MTVRTEIANLFEASVLPTSKYDTYFPIYEDLFSRFKGRNITFVEVGILGGGSLEVWRKYFGPESRIIGVDLNPALKPLLEKRGFEIFVGDQADPAFWDGFYRAVGDIDILLDDGGHSNLQTWMTFAQAVKHVRDGGIVAIEDTHASYLRDFGNPCSRSFVSRAKLVCDELHSRSGRIAEKEKGACRHRAVFAEVDVASLIFTVRFYESIVAFVVDRRLSKESRQASYGRIDQLPQSRIPDDLRYKGICDTDLTPLSQRMRRLIDRLVKCLRR